MFGHAFGEVLAFGVGVALSPLAIVAVVVMLVAPGGPQTAWAFVAGWVISLSLVSTVVLLADGGDASGSGEPATWVSVVKIVVAVLLVLFALRQRRGRGEAEDEAPAWMRRLDNVTVAKAFWLATLVNVVKPTNLLLAIGAGVPVAQVGASPAGQAVGIAAFVIIATAAPGIPLAIHLAMPNRGGDVLLALRDWMVRENTIIIAVVSLIIAAKLIGDALVSLTS
jgi:threonine/homoserine/homoserine lactone efflux protein